MIVTINEKCSLFMIWDTKNKLTRPIFDWFYISGQSPTIDIYVGF